MLNIFETRNCCQKIYQVLYMKKRIQYNACTRCQVQYVQLKYIDIQFMLLTVLWQKVASSFWMWVIQINNYVSSTHIDIIQCFITFTKTTGKYWSQKTVIGTNRNRWTKAKFSDAKRNNWGLRLFKISSSFFLLLFVTLWSVNHF